MSLLQNCYFLHKQKAVISIHLFHLLTGFVDMKTQLSQFLAGFARDGKVRTHNDILNGPQICVYNDSLTPSVPMPQRNKTGCIVKEKVALLKNLCFTITFFYWCRIFLCCFFWSKISSIQYPQFYVNTPTSLLSKYCNVIILYSIIFFHYQFCSPT